MTAKLTNPPTCDHCSRTAQWMVTVEAKGLGPMRGQAVRPCAGKYPRRYRVVLTRSNW